MSLQWTIAAGFLYAEIAAVLLLVLAPISPKKWCAIFRSRFLQVVGSQARWWFIALLAVLVLFLLDSIREMRKYSHPEHSEMQLQTEMQNNMKMFRAQRNFYISGFALFLSFVIRRLVDLISNQASLMAENEAALKQAKSASETAKQLLAQSSGSGEAAQNTRNEEHQKQINELKKELSEAKNNLKKAEVDKEAVVAQAKSLENEYDRLSEEHRKLQQKVEGGGDKKEE